MSKDFTLDDLRETSSNDPIDQLRMAIATYDKKLAKKTVESIIKNKIDTGKALEAMTDTIRLIGTAFEKGECFLPDMLSAAETMESVMPILEDQIKKEGKERVILGKVVLGTVKGDIHSIGKTMVGTLLSANGFKVYDLGIDVSSEKFVNAIKKYDPDILAMSALLTITAYEQKNVIDRLKKMGLRSKIKIMVGGAPITQEFANSIGADGYDPTAPGAVLLAKKLLKRERIKNF